MAYFTSIESQKDRDLNRAIPWITNVLLSPDDPAPIGMAFHLGPNGAGRPLWKLNIDGIWVEGRFAIVDREFRPEK